MQNVSGNTVRSTRFAGVERWYYFVNLFFICRSYYERTIDLDDNKFLNDLFENLIFERTISATVAKKVMKRIWEKAIDWDWIINIFFIVGD